MRATANYLALMVLLLLSAASLAKERPLWELGLGLGGLYQSCYTGTEQGCHYGFPVLLPVYRGDFFQSDDKGLRAQLLKNPRYQLDLSADFNFAVDSDEIDLREGMPDIGHLLELGPSMEVTAYQGAYHQWYFNFPLRAVFEIDGREIDGAGYSFSPGLVMEQRLANAPWRLGASLAAQFGSEYYHGIYYRVDPRYARLGRPAYQASSGYGGARLQLSLTSKTDKHLWVLFARYDAIDGAVFVDSPLVETQHNITLGFLYSRYLFKSKTMVAP